MSDDLVKRLRDGCSCNRDSNPCMAEEECRDADEAADEIERLRARVAELEAALVEDDEEQAKWVEGLTDDWIVAEARAEAAEARVAELEAERKLDHENINLKADFIENTINQLAAAEARIEELEVKLATARQDAMDE